MVCSMLYIIEYKLKVNRKLVKVFVEFYYKKQNESVFLQEKNRLYLRIFVENS